MDSRPNETTEEKLRRARALVVIGATVVLIALFLLLFGPLIWPAE